MTTTSDARNRALASGELDPDSSQVRVKDATKSESWQRLSKR